MCDLDDGERADCWVVTTRRARKPHTCATCHMPIAVGETYVRTFAAFDGRGEAECSCRACREAQEEFGHAHGATPWPSGTRETFEECVRDGVMDLSLCLAGPYPRGPMTVAERLARVAQAEPSERRWRQLLAGIKGRARKAKHEGRRRLRQVLRAPNAAVHP